MKKNPFDLTAKILARIGMGVMYAFFATMATVLLVLYPILLLQNGRPWWEAFAPHLALVGIVLISTAVLVIMAYVGLWWQRAANNWDRKHR